MEGNREQQVIRPTGGRAVVKAETEEQVGRGAEGRISHMLDQTTGNR